MKNSKVLKLGFCVIMSFLLLACSSENLKVVTPLNTPKKIEIKETSVILDNCFRYSFLVDSLLVFISECDTNIFHVYNKNTLEFIMKFGTKGRAPFEFYSPMPFHSNTTTPNENRSYYFYDVNLGQTKQIEFNKIIQGFDVSECITSTVDENLFGSIRLNQLEGDKIAGLNVDHSEGLFFIYDKESGQSVWIDYLPQYRMQQRYRNTTYRGKLCSDGKIIAFASRFFDQVLFFNNEGQLLKEHYFSEVKMPILSKEFSGVVHESTIYSLAIYGNSKSCFVDRINKSVLDLIEMGHPPTQLLEFDWNGSLINIYEFNTRPNAFCVDETTNTLYCTLQDEVPNGSVKIAKIAL